MALHGQIPDLIILISGKRKCGKDFLAEKLLAGFSEGDAVILRISGPLKKEFARIHQLSFDRLSDSSPYKEEFRKEMVRWSDEIREKDPFYFCHLTATDAMESSAGKIWIVSDIRRSADVRYFQENFGEKFAVPIFKVRVEASEETRARRGWKFEAGIDDAETECGLDNAGVNWDFVVENNDQGDLEASFQILMGRILELSNFCDVVL